jgi:hypothetical protein
MRSILYSMILWLIPAAAFAKDFGSTASNTGVSGIWVLANISYAGMRAQNNLSKGWRIVAFIFGLPGTIVTYFVVKDGDERAYGVDLPKKQG